MIDLEEMKEIMAARAEVTKVLGGMFLTSPKFIDIYTLCKSLGDMLDAVEVVDEKDELLEGYNDLQDWYLKASEIKQAIIDIKLSEEFNELFRKPTAISIDFPHDVMIAKAYQEYGYSIDESISPSNLSAMLSFIGYMAVACASEVDEEKIVSSAKVQAAFVENHIMPLLSDFCAILYERAVSYGVYRYLAVILHGYMNYDSATIKYFR